MKNRTKAYYILFIALLICSVTDCRAQKVAVSTNSLGWLVLSPNVNLEVALDRHNTLSVEAYALPWNINSKFSVAHFTISPEYKYYFTMPYYGHYLGANLLYSTYDRIKDSQTKRGNLIAAGVTYGYSIIIGKRWNLVPNIGAGVGVDFSNGKRKFLFVPTKIGVNIQLLIR